MGFAFIRIVFSALTATEAGKARLSRRLRLAIVCIDFRVFERSASATLVQPVQPLRGLI